MGMSYKSGFCAQCNQQSKVSRANANHILHLILSVLTAGLWIIVWIGVAVKFGGWRCETCGSTSISSVR